MKTDILHPLSWVVLTVALPGVLGQQPSPDAPSPPPLPAPTMTLSVTNTAPPAEPAAPTNPPSATETAVATNPPPAAPVAAPPPPEPPMIAVGENELLVNFRNAPIDLVLHHFSEAAGFIIELQTPVRGTVDVFSAKPVTKEEAVDLLNSMLNKNGYAAIRNGRRLTIVSKTDAMRRDIPVKTGNDPEAIPRNDELVTQIIPIRFVDATQLAKDLAPLVSPQAMIVANEAGNSIAITDTQANIRHLVEIIKAIDSSAEDETLVRVFMLKYADPVEMADLLTNLFPDQSNLQAPIRSSSRSGGPFGGPSGGPFGFISSLISGRPPPAPGMGAAQQQQRIRKRMQVVAVPDARTQSVVVTASKDLMEQIAEVIQQLDFESPKQQRVQMFHLKNADPQEVLPVLQDMFQSTTSGRGGRSSTQNSPLMNRIQQEQRQSTTGTTGTRIGTGLGTGRTGPGTTF